MLTPALQRLLQQISANGAQDDFERDLQQELVSLDALLTAAQQLLAPERRKEFAGTTISGVGASLSKGSLSLDYEGVFVGSSAERVGAALGLGSDRIALTTKCSNPDCPNKKIK
jgi:hypothetical protein